MYYTRQVKCFERKQFEAPMSRGTCCPPTACREDNMNIGPWRNEPFTAAKGNWVDQRNNQIVCGGARARICDLLRRRWQVAVRRSAASNSQDGARLAESIVPIEWFVVVIFLDVIFWCMHEMGAQTHHTFGRVCMLQNTY